MHASIGGRPTAQDSAAESGRSGSTTATLSHTGPKSYQRLGAPAPTGPDAILFLQRSAGNGAVSAVLGTSATSVQRSGQPLAPADRSRMERRFGHSLADVRVHADRDEADQVGAEAYTQGPHIIFAPGAYAPGTDAGGRLLAHELTHVLQQEHGEGTESASLSHDDVAEAEARQAESTDEGAQVATVTPTLRVVARRPRELVPFTFLGRSVEGGINPALRVRLTAVQTHLRAVFDALPTAERLNFETGTAAGSFEDWTGITTVKGWRPGLGTSKHQSGAAVDVNYNRQPYIATRGPNSAGRTVYGGEAAGAGLQAERRAATEVYDRALSFTVVSGMTADVAGARSGETTGQAHQRFAIASDALRNYFRFAFVVPPGGAPDVNRAPMRNIETASQAQLLARIPEGERRPQAEAEQLLTDRMTGFFWRFLHSDWPYDIPGTYFRILRDYEHVRIPMVKGNPDPRPAVTRSPVNGFLHMRREFVETMRDVGHLRWGAIDFGQAENGDVHHFDLGSHGGVVPDGTP